jgi:hypothetical protein
MSNPLVYAAGAVADPLGRDLARRIELEPLAAAPDDTPGVWPAEIMSEIARLLTPPSSSGR